jgi:hypothetical protein
MYAFAVTGETVVQTRWVPWAMLAFAAALSAAFKWFSEP